MRTTAAALLLLISHAARGQFGAGPAPAEAPTPPATESERIQELQQQLEAERTINAELRARLKEAGPDAAQAPPVGLREALAPETSADTTAIREALINRSLAVLPFRAFRIAAETEWIHSGTNDTRSDALVASIAPSAGLPMSAMISATIPYVHADTAAGSHGSIGDVGVSITKQIVDEADAHPSLLASVGYLHNSGDAFRPVATGNGFRILSAGIAAVRSIEPVVLFGNVSYGHPFARDVSARDVLGEAEFRGRIAPADQFSFRAGASLLATPTIDFDASVSGLFSGMTEVRSGATGTYRLPASTLVLAELGASFVLSRNLALLTSVSAGLTDDAPDVAIGIALPYRF